MSKQVGNTACILAYIFNSTYRQCHEVWALHFSSPLHIHDAVLLIEVYLSGHINWSLAQAHKHSSLDCPRLQSL